MTRKAVFHDAGTYDDGGSPLTLGGVSSVAKSGDTELTGDVTFSEGTNVTLTQSGNDIEIASTASGSTELDYVEYNAADITVSGSSGSPTTVLTGNSVSYDGSTRIKVEFYTAGVFAGSAALIVELWEDSSAIERLVQTNSTLGAPGYGVVFRTPSNASHAHHIKAWKNGGTDGAIAAAATFAPIFLRITTA